MTEEETEQTGKPNEQKNAVSVSEVPPRGKSDSAMKKLRRRVSGRDPAVIAVFEARICAAAIIAIIIAIILWTVAVSTKFWFHVKAPDSGPVYINRTNNFFVRSHSGIWTICKYIINGTQNGPITGSCHNHRLFPTSEQLQKNPEVDGTILDYTRTEVAFSIISYCLMFMGLGFAIYAFKHPRYTFKRLAGAVHFISAAAILVVIEVVVNSVRYEESYLTDRHPKGTEWTYGYSFIVAWITFVMMVLSGICFMATSRKKKGDRALGFGGDTDEPHIIGRL